MSVWGKSPYLSRFSSKHKIKSQIRSYSAHSVSLVLVFIFDYLTVENKEPHLLMPLTKLSAIRRLMNAPSQVYGDMLDENEIGLSLGFS
jgi:hypothetical protein